MCALDVQRQHLQWEQDWGICSLGIRDWVPWPTRLALSPPGQGMEPCSLFTSQTRIVVSPNCLSDAPWNERGHFQGIWCRKAMDGSCKALPAFIPAWWPSQWALLVIAPAHQALVHKELLYIQPRGLFHIGWFSVTAANAFGTGWHLQTVLVRWISVIYCKRYCQLSSQM